LGEASRGSKSGSRRVTCTTVCTQIDAETLEAAIARLTVVLTTAAVDAIPGLVDERRAMREELQAMRERALHATPADEHAVGSARHFAVAGRADER
jgi:hypothetical protein